MAKNLMGRGRPRRVSHQPTGQAWVFTLAEVVDMTMSRRNGGSRVRVDIRWDGSYHAPAYFATVSWGPHVVPQSAAEVRKIVREAKNLLCDSFDLSRSA